MPWILHVFRSFWNWVWFGSSDSSLSCRQTGSSAKVMWPVRTFLRCMINLLAAFGGEISRYAWTGNFSDVYSGGTNSFWFLESLRVVCPMSTLLAGPSLPMHNRAQFGWMPLSGLQGYALHSAAFRGTPASQAPLPTLFSVDEFKLGKCPVRGFPICVAWAHGIFLQPFSWGQATAIACRCLSWRVLSVFFLLPTLLPIVCMW